jgi:hypothetical protein
LSSLPKNEFFSSLLEIAEPRAESRENNGPETAKAPRESFCLGAIRPQEPDSKTD